MPLNEVLMLAMIKNKTIAYGIYLNYKRILHKLIFRLAVPLN